MDQQPNKPPSDGPPPTPPRRGPPTIWLLLLVGVAVAWLWNANREPEYSEISYGMFDRQLKDLDNLSETDCNIAEATVQGQTIIGRFKVAPKDPDPQRQEAAEEKKGAGGKDDAKNKSEPLRLKKDFKTEFSTPFINEEHDKLLLQHLGAKYHAKERDDSSGLIMIIYLMVTVGIFVGLLWFMFRRARDQFMGGGMLAGFGKSPAKRYNSGDMPTTFDDVAGLTGVKNDLQEVVDFLKNPEKFQRLGGRVPKGILLMGPPGTGKTLLGRAVAGEADVPFFSINGSEFIQMFVGVGASRVRDMFATAKENAPAILFIDEIDAVGRHRGAGLGGGHDEREQTLNQILSEMDGFLQTESVIVLAATNRPDVLDPALLRPGRFDRHIMVDRPNYKGRLAIFKVHSRDVPLSDDVDLERMAKGTVGLTGADIRNLVNEAALWASRHDRDAVIMDDFDHARDKILMGSKREDVLSGKEKTMTAYHESGHTLAAWLVDTGDRVHKVSIIPRGRALGATQLLPEEDRLNVGESDLHKRLLVLLAGRSAEKLIFDEHSAGAEDDLNRATQLARRMVTVWGMSERLGPVAFRDVEDQPFLGKEIAEPRRFSEHTAQVIDEEIIRILREASEQAAEMLVRHRDKLDTLAGALEKEETLDEADIADLIGPPAYHKADDDDRS